MNAKMILSIAAVGGATFAVLYFVTRKTQVTANGLAQPAGVFDAWYSDRFSGEQSSWV